MMTSNHRGFTLIEVVVSLAIVGALVVITYGGLRVGLAAWQQGEDRAEAHQHVRGVVTLLTRSIATACPLRIRVAENALPVVQFDGMSHRLSFVTPAPPFPLDVTIAFTAVQLDLDAGEPGGLIVSERALPNREIFTRGFVVFRDPAIRNLTFRYLRPGGEWDDRWDGAVERNLPGAVKIAIDLERNGRTHALPAVSVSLRMLKT